jgi:hypothetical protein
MGTTKLSGLSNSKKSARMMARFAAIAAGLGFIGQAAAQGFPTRTRRPAAVLSHGYKGLGRASKPRS